MFNIKKNKMITLYILCVLYTFFGFRRFKKLYGNYDILDKDLDFTFLLMTLSLTTVVTVTGTIALIFIYLP